MKLLPLSNSELMATITREPWFASATQRRLEDQLRILGSALNDYDTKRMAAIQQATRLAADIAEAMTIPQADRRREVLLRCQARACDLARTLRSGIEELTRRAYLPLLPTEGVLVLADAPLRRFAASLKARYEDVVLPDTESCIATVNQMNERCGEELFSKQKGVKS